MIDPSIDLSRILQGPEKALWAQSIDEQSFWDAERKAKRQATLWLTGLIMVGPFLIIRTYIDLRPGAFEEGVDLFDAAVVTILLGAIFYFMRLLVVMRTFKADLNGVALKYVITNKRLIALNQDYSIVDEMRHAEMEFLVEQMPSKEILVSRRDNPGADQNFHILRTDHIPEARLIIQTILQER